MNSAYFIICSSLLSIAWLSSCGGGASVKVSSDRITQIREDQRAAGRLAGFCVGWNSVETVGSINQNILEVSSISPDGDAFIVSNDSHTEVSGNSELFRIRNTSKTAADKTYYSLEALNAIDPGDTDNVNDVEASTVVDCFENQRCLLTYSNRLPILYVKNLNTDDPPHSIRIDGIKSGCQPNQNGSCSGFANGADVQGISVAMDQVFVVATEWKNNNVDDSGFAGNSVYRLPFDLTASTLTAQNIGSFPMEVVAASVLKGDTVIDAFSLLNDQGEKLKQLLALNLLSANTSNFLRSLFDIEFDPNSFHEQVQVLDTVIQQSMLEHGYADEETAYQAIRNEISTLGISRLLETLTFNPGDFYGYLFVRDISVAADGQTVLVMTLSGPVTFQINMLSDILPTLWEFAANSQTKFVLPLHNLAETKPEVFAKNHLYLAQMEAGFMRMEPNTAGEDVPAIYYTSERRPNYDPGAEFAAHDLDASGRRLFYRDGSPVIKLTCEP